MDILTQRLRDLVLTMKVQIANLQAQIAQGAIAGALTDDQLRASPVPVSGSFSVSGGLTNTELRASAVPVTVSNLPATQPVSGTVSISGTVPVSGTFWQATQPVSIASMPTTPVTGTFWQATQPVSAASLPLPSGAATSAKQPALGTAGAASADVLTVQGVASMVALKVDGSGVTQPVSGTVGISGTVPVSGTFWQATQPVSIAATVGVNNAQVGGTSVATGNGVVGAGVQRVAIASDNTAFSVNAAQSGTWNIGTLTSITNSVATTAPTLTKGTQGANGWTTQDLKDSGRSYKVFSATFTAATTEALITLTPITDGSAGGTGTSFTVTNGKRFRIQALSVTTRNAGAAIQGVVVNLRTNTAGATTATSNLLLTVGAGTLSATANSVATGFADIPDGLEIAGNGTITFGISQIGTATAGNNVTLIGYEY